MFIFNNESKWNSKVSRFLVLIYTFYFIIIFKKNYILKHMCGCFTKYQANISTLA
jgi:hypothetical protein